MASESRRIRAFDWLKGLAVLLMIQCHALVLLKPTLRIGPWPRRLDFIDGLVAPAFVFTAGFSLALVQVRSAASGSRRSRIVKTLRRIIEVLLVASLLNWMWFPILDQPQWLLRIDILHCIGLALLIALPLLAWLSPRPKLLCWVCLGLGLAVFGVSPLAESIRGPWARFVNPHTGSVFPLLPWAGYVYLGASTGVVGAAGRPLALVRWLLMLLVLSGITWWATPLFLKLYPPHQFWISDPANHAQRLVPVLTAVLVLLVLEWKAGGEWTRSPPMRFVEAFGTSSLSGYFFHQALLYYQVFGFSFHSWWGDRCTWPKYLALTAALVALTFALCQIIDSIYRPLNQWANRAIDRLFKASA